MANKKQRPEPAPEDAPVIPVTTKGRIPAGQVRGGLADDFLAQVQAAMKPPIGGAALGLSKDAFQAMNAAMNAPMKGIAEELAKSSARLARIQVADVEKLAARPETIRMPTPPEVVISEALREEIGSLTEITQAMNTQMTAIVTIAAELGPALKDYADKAEKRSRSLNWLTAALVALTAVLAIPVLGDFVQAVTDFPQRP